MQRSRLPHNFVPLALRYTALHRVVVKDFLMNPLTRTLGNTDAYCYGKILTISIKVKRGNSCAKAFSKR
jgi:hypothetical protein